MIYLVAPNATHPSGGVGMAAQWVRLLLQHGHEAMFITPNGDPSPYWLNFKVPAGSYADMVDVPENKRVDIWLDCMVENPRKAMQGYFFAQDVCQLEHVLKEKGMGPNIQAFNQLSYCKLITITHHAHWYYLYRYGLKSKIVNNFVDTSIFKPGPKNQSQVCMIRHRDHFSQDIADRLTTAGLQVRIAEGSQEQVAQAMRESLFFISDVRGRWDGCEYSEGMPLPIMEAMACGCITIARDTNGVREFISHGTNAYLLPNDDRFPVSAVNLILTNAHLRTMGPIADATMVLTYTGQRVWKQIQEALDL